MNCGTIILTSFYRDYIKIVISSRCNIVIEHLPERLMHDAVLIEVRDENGICVYQEIAKLFLPYEFNLSYLNDGYYTLFLFCKSKSQSNSYIGLNTSNGFPFEMHLGAISTIVSRPFDNNREFFLRLSEKFISKNEKTTVSNKQFIPSELLGLSHNITRYSFSNYDKILAVHDWVADNIYYDYDSLVDNSYIRQKHDALSVIHRKRTVCAGYSELAVTLLRAAGIAAVNVDCFALGESAYGDWNVQSNMEREANHVVTFAYADDRWVMMDVTWDSDNEYRNARYCNKTGYGVSHQYFDCTLAFFSYTHRFIK